MKIISLFIFTLAFIQVFGQKQFNDHDNIHFPQKRHYGPVGAALPAVKNSASDTGFTLTNIPVDRSPQQVVIPTGSNKAFVMCMGTSVIKVVNLETATVVNTISLNAFPEKMVMNSSGTKIFIPTLSSQIPTVYPSDDCGGIGFPISTSPVIVLNTMTESIDTIFNNICSMNDIVLSPDESVMYLIGCQDYITSYRTDTYAHIYTYNIAALTGNSTQNYYAALADSVHKLFLYSWVFIGAGEEDRILALDLVNNTIHQIPVDTLGYHSVVFNPIFLSPDKHDLYVNAGFCALPPYTPATFIFDAATESLKEIIPQISTAGESILFSDSSAFFDDAWLFGNKTLFNFREYTPGTSYTVGGCSGVLSADKQTLYLTQIGATHYSGVTYGSPQQYDVTFLDIVTGKVSRVNVADETFTCSYERMIAMTSDGHYLITTNSALNTVSVLDFSPATGLTFRSSKDRVITHPNPCKDFLWIDIRPELGNRVDILLYDLTGKIAVKMSDNPVQGNTAIKLSTESLPSGIYFMQVTGVGGIETRKVVIGK